MRQAGTIQFVISHSDHGVVGPLLRQSAGIDSIYFQKIERGLHARTLVPVKVSLAFRDVESVCRRYFVEVSVTLKIDVHRLSDRRFQCTIVPQTMDATKRVNLIAVDLLYLFPS